MPELPTALPTSASVARAWQAQTRRGLQLDLPDPSLADAVEANRRYMLLFHDGSDITPGPSTYHRFWFRDAAYMLSAMDRYGLHAETAEVLRSYPARQHVDGYYFSQRQEWDSNGAAIWALAEHWRLTRDTEVLAATIQSVSRGVRWIERKRHSKRRRRDATLVGPEARGSSPVRIVRDDATRASPEIEGLYPVGEGAGYAGGIVSAAVDGLRTARAIVAHYAVPQN